MREELVDEPRGDELPEERRAAFAEDQPVPAGANRGDRAHQVDLRPATERMNLGGRGQAAVEARGSFVARQDDGALAQPRVRGVDPTASAQHGELGLRRTSA